MEQTGDYWDRFPDAMRMMDLFLKTVAGIVILDVGSGGGRDSAIFQKRGFTPIAMDASREMLSIASAKGLRTALMDFENIGFADAVVDGVWAYASLLHLPHDKFVPVLVELNRILKQGGPILISMKQGEGEEYIESPERWKKDVRYFTFWQEEELLEALFEAGFKAVEVNRPQGNFIDILAIKEN